MKIEIKKTPIDDNHKCSLCDNHLSVIIIEIYSELTDLCALCAIEIYNDILEIVANRSAN